MCDSSQGSVPVMVAISHVSVVIHDICPMPWGAGTTFVMMMVVLHVRGFVSDIVDTYVHTW